MRNRKGRKVLLIVTLLLVALVAFVIGSRVYFLQSYVKGIEKKCAKTVTRDKESNCVITQILENGKEYLLDITYDSEPYSNYVVYTFSRKDSNTIVLLVEDGLFASQNISFNVTLDEKLKKELGIDSDISYRLKYDSNGKLQNAKDKDQTIYDANKEDIEELLKLAKKYNLLRR